MTFVTLWSPALPTAGAGRQALHRAAPGREADGPAADLPDTRVALLHPLIERLLALTPHVVADPRDGGTLLWVDVRGLPVPRVAQAVLHAAQHAGVQNPSVGVSRVAVVAEVAACAGVAPLTIVKRGDERRFLVGHPLTVMVVGGVLPGSPAASAVGAVSARTPTAARQLRLLLDALADVGIETCGDLARLTREAVEVRFGPDVVALWRLARADDARRIFRRVPRGLPAASLEWLEFELRDLERLVFIANRLAERVCTELQTRGEVARAMALTFSLTGGGAVNCAVRGARPTADRATWLRLVRAAFERVELPDAVRGLTLRVETVEPADAPQGDLFDVGFQTGAAGETAVARLVDDRVGRAVELTTSAHPLPERRAQWRSLDADEVARTLRGSSHVAPGSQHTATSSGADRPTVIAAHRRPSAGGHTLGSEVSSAALVSEPPPPDAPAGESLALRLLAEPRRVVVTTRQRRGYAVPVRYRERLQDGARARHGMPLLDVLTAAGPDRMAVGQESGAPVTREYWQCLTGDGQLVLLFRDAAPGDAVPGQSDDVGDAGGVWYLHGWWD